MFRQYLWSMATEIARYTIQPVVALLLARLLAPGDFGVAGLCYVAISLLQIFKDGGLGDVVVQSEDESVVDFAFSVQLLIACLLAASLAALAPVVAWFYGQPELTAPLRLLALSFLLSPFIDIPIRLSQRQLNFRVVFLRSVIAPALGGAVSISLAIAGFGFWSLIVGTLCGQVASAIALPILIAWRPRLCFSIGGRDNQIKFGMHMLAQGCLRWLKNSIGKVALGKVQAPSSLGFYEVAQQAANMPYNLIAGALQRLTFPLFSKQVRENRDPTPVFLSLVSRLALITVPIGFFLAWSAEDLILLFLGERWLPMRWMFVACLVVANAAAIVNINVSIFKAVNRPAVLTRFMIARVLISIPFYVYASTLGLNALAVAVAALAVLMGPVNSFLACRVLGTSYANYVTVLARNTFLPAIVLSAVGFLMQRLNYAPFASLTLNMIALGTVTLVNISWFDPELVKIGVGKLQQLFARRTAMVKS